MSVLRLDGAVPGDGNVDPWVESGDEEDFCVGFQDVGPHLNWSLVSTAHSLRRLAQRRIGIVGAVRNLILLHVVEGDWPQTGPWHKDGWVEKFCEYSYSGH